MDLLGDILGSLAVYSHSIGTFDLAAPWGLEVSAMDATAAFSFSVVEGDFWLSVAGGEAVLLEPGDSALVMGGVPHRYGSSPDAPMLSLSELWAERNLPGWGETRSGPIQMQWGDGPRRTRLLGLGITIQEPAHNPLLAALPAFIVLRRGQGALDLWHDTALRFCETEAAAPTPGFSATAKHLTELIFSGLIRAYVGSETQVGASWLRGLSDPRIGRALATMHLRPGEGWSAAGLAAEVGMSRANFARRFQALVGKSPIEYLTDCRMQMAAGRLVEQQQTVGQVAEAVGYRSERAFRQAFRQRFGVAPRDYARRHRPV